MSGDQKVRARSCSAAVAVLFMTLPLSSLSVDVPDALSAGWKGEKRCENLYEDAQIRILRCTFPANTGHESHSHPAHITYVLGGGRGRAIDSSGTRDFESKTDDFRVNRPVQWHEMVNTGETTHRYLIIEKKYEADK